MAETPLKMAPNDLKTFMKGFLITLSRFEHSRKRAMDLRSCDGFAMDVKNGPKTFKMVKIGLKHGFLYF